MVDNWSYDPWTDLYDASQKVDDAREEMWNDLQEAWSRIDELSTENAKLRAELQTCYALLDDLSKKLGV